MTIDNSLFNINHSRPTMTMQISVYGRMHDDLQRDNYLSNKETKDYIAYSIIHYCAAIISFLE